MTGLLCAKVKAKTQPIMRIASIKSPRNLVLIRIARMRLVWFGSLAIAVVLLGLFPSIARPQVPPANNAPQQPQAPGVYGIDRDDATPTVERPPFDRVTLTSDGDNAILYIHPLDIVGHIDPAAQTGSMKFELLDRPNQTFVVLWRFVAKVERFDEIIIEETRRAYSSGDYNAAFSNLMYVYDERGANDPIIQELLEPFWFADAQSLLQSNKNELALSVLEELYRRDRNFAAQGSTKRVADLIAAGYDRLLSQYEARKDFNGLVAKLAEIKQKYPKPEAPIGAMMGRWDAVLEKKKQQLADDLAAVARGDDPVKANEAVRTMQYSVPEDSRTRPLFAEVFEHSPAIIVGTNQLDAAPDAASLDNWTARRLGTLLTRQLVELVGLGDDGGLYAYNEGQVVPVDEFGRTFRFEIEKVKQQFKSPMSAFELARRIGSLVNEHSPDFYFPLAKLVSSVEIMDNSNVQVRLNRPYARFESLFRVPRSSKSDENSGIYQPGQGFDGDKSFKVYTPNPQFLRGDDQQMPLIVEKKFDNNSLATQALIRGEVDVVERVFPADLRKLHENPQIAVRAYAVPTVHLLVPNLRNAFMQNPTFRRGLLYAIDRNSIVKNLICGGQELSGFNEMSGPFPIGTEQNDLIGYGYNSRIQPTKFDPRMAIVSPAVVLGRMRKDAKERLRETRMEELVKMNLDEDGIDKQLEQWINEDKSLVVPPLVLAYPDGDIAVASCEMMKQMWSSVGIDVELRPLPPGTTRPADDDYDLLYVESTMEEPLSDARKLFGDLGIVKVTSPAIELLMGELDTAKNWVAARNILRQIHLHSQYDVTILPLWQTINYYAYRRNIRGLDGGLIHLYDDVANWRIDVPGEE